MRKRKTSRKKMFRDFLYQDTKDLQSTYLKRLQQSRRAFSNDDIYFAELEFLMWAYDLQFFTIKWAADQLDLNSNNFANRYIYPLLSKGYIYKHFDRLTPSDTAEEHIFREATQSNSRVRNAITQKAPITVQPLYRQN